MKVIVDLQIPYLRGNIEQLADEIVYLPGREITAAVVANADALIVRTRTRCDAALLRGSKVQFIATATIGFDHIDQAYCREAGIVWRSAPGCNAASVEQYVVSSLYLLQRERGLSLKGATIGVVGVGNVGSRVAAAAARLGMRVLLCDPPRAKHEAGFVTLEVVQREADIITFHTPLTHEGEDATFHLADETFFQSLSKPVVLLNTSRGEVVDNEALLRALECGSVSEAVIDVWEHEPNISLPLLEKAFIATPHIAGYSADGKANATRMALEALCDHFHIAPHFCVTPPPPPIPIIYIRSEEEAQLISYDPRTDDAALRANPEQFEQLRGNYPLRRELTAYEVVYD